MMTKHTPSQTVKGTILPCGLLSIAQCLCSFFLISDLSATIRTVPNDFRSIQSAIDKANTGDTILISEGVYYENLRIINNIVLASRFIIDQNTAHISNTIIDGSKAKNRLKGSTIFITGPTDTTCRVMGLTIRGGTGTYDHAPENPLTEHWIVGGGIFVLNAGARISHNIITKNALSSVGKYEHISGAGICTIDHPDHSAAPAYIIIENNIVTENIAAGKWIEDCGIGVVQPGIIRHNIITYNRSIAKARAPSGGLGIYFSRRYDIIVDGNYIRYNKAGFGGGMTVYMARILGGRAMIINNIIADNEATENGGGIFITRANAILINNTIVGNKAFSRGSAIHSIDGAVVTLVNNIIWNNDPRPITYPANIQAVNNLIEGGFPGVNTVNANPLFVEGDTTFGLSSQSPAIGVGTSSIYAGRIFYEFPSVDFRSERRPFPEFSKCDLGAVESRYGANGNTSDILEEWADLSGNHLKLTLSLRQITSPQYSADSMQILQAGLLSASVIENDSVEHILDEGSEELSFTLPPEHNMLRVELLARGLAESTHLYGILYMEGLESSSETLPRSGDFFFTQYNNLFPGTYKLVFQAGDEVGFIDAVNLKSVQIVVQPFWYRRWWAYMLGVLFIAGIFMYVYSREFLRHRREQRLHQEFTKKQFEWQEAGRKHLASELHDGLGQDLLVINNELQQFLKDEKFSRNDMNRVAEILHDSIESVREISSNLHPHHIERLGFCSAVEAMVEKLSHSSSIHIQCMCDQVENDMSMETKIHLYRIIQESLTNILKHSGASEAQLTISKKSSSIEIAIRDNGKGFDTERFYRPGAMQNRTDAALGFGLTSITERARIINGTLSIESVLQKGTIINLTLPLSKGTV